MGSDAIVKTMEQQEKDTKKYNVFSANGVGLYLIDFVIAFVSETGSFTANRVGLIV